MGTFPPKSTSATSYTGGQSQEIQILSKVEGSKAILACTWYFYIAARTDSFQYGLIYKNTTVSVDLAMNEQGT